MSPVLRIQEVQDFALRVRLTDLMEVLRGSRETPLVRYRVSAFNYATIITIDTLSI
jgi:hypothetical protein